MALVFADRVKETTTTAGTGAVTLAGAVTGYQSFTAGIGNGNTCYYCIASQTLNTWEVGLGTYSTTGPTLTRTTPLAGSSATPVTFGSETKDVFVTSPALWATSPSFTGNVGTAQLSVGTTDTTTAYAYIAPTQSTLQHQFAVAGTNNFNGATVQGLNLVPTLTGGASTTTLYGVISNPKFTGVTGTVTGVIGVQSNPQYNSSGSITNFSALITNIAIGTSGTGAITNSYSNRAQAPTISAAAAITNFYQYFAAEAAPGSGTITNAYSYYGSQTTASGATNNWNLYMTGNAPNYLAGQLSIGTTSTSVAHIYAVPTTTLQYQFLMQGTNTYAGVNPTAMYINPNINGTGATTGSLIGLNVTPIFSPLVAVGNVYATNSTAYLNSSFAPVSAIAYRGVIQLSATSLTGTITNAFAFYAEVPAISASATTAITLYSQFYASNIAGTAGSAISSAAAFYGNQASSNTGVTNNWNLYMNGTASNYLKGSLYLGSTTAASAILTGRSAANLTLGLADAAAPVAQTLSVQNVVAGTTDTAGTNFTITGSRGTGTGAGGSILFQTATASTTGSTQNALATALTIASTGTVTAGALVATTLNGNTFTTGTYTLTGTAAKTLNFTNSLTLTGTDSTVMTFPTTTATIARTDAAQTFTGTQTFGALVATTLNGNTFTTGTYTLTGTAAKTLNFTNTLTLSGTDSTVMTFPTTSATIARTDAAQTFTGIQTFTAPVLGTPGSGTLSNCTVDGTAGNNVGFINIPQLSKTAAYILAAADRGKHVSITTGGVTVNVSTFAAGDAVTIFNNSASAQTITQGTSVTMYLAGTATTGNRTLAQRGICTILCISSAVYVISGAGLT